MKINAAGLDLIKRYADVKTDSDCWLYTGGTFVYNGTRRLKYGQIKYEGRTWRAHRLVAQLCGGKLTPSISVCHTCDTPLCLNPAHLFLGSNADNVADKVSKGRHRSVCGEKNGRATITDQQVLQVRALALAGANQRVLASQFKISQSLVSMIKRGKTRGTTSCV